MITDWHIKDDGLNYGAADASADGTHTVSVDTYATVNELGEACYGLRATINGEAYIACGSFYKATDWQALADGLIGSVVAGEDVPAFCTPSA